MIVQLHLEWYPLLGFCSCRQKVCENTDPKEILEYESSDGEDDIDDKEGENNE